MKVDLAYPYSDDKGTEHPPDKTVDVPEAVGKQLIREGRARPGAGSASKARAATPGKPRAAKRAAVKATPSKAPAPGADNTKEEGS